MNAFLTDSERRWRPEKMRQQYRLWLDFRVGFATYRRWFQTAEDREQYAKTVVNSKAVAIDRGEEYP